jgi:hypothetical protein
MGQDDIAELQHCHQQLAEAEARCGELERINLDLERRLEAQAKERMRADKEVAQEVLMWEERLAQADAKSEEWKGRCEMEQKHREVVLDKLRRTERELHRILQKKYDIVKVAKAEERTAIRERTHIARELAHQAGNSMYIKAAESGRGKLTSNPRGAGAAAVRSDRVVDSLSDFYGL